MANSPMLRRLSGLTKYTEAWLAGLLLIILGLIIVPMPPTFIDFLICINLMFSVVILINSMYITRALDFSVFPSMLLVTTLLRISISIAVARLILSKTAENYKHGGVDAALDTGGHVIAAFGKMVAGGNAVIGIIMFVIITVVQFVIVAQGAGRVSEVAARFTLDAMPGKQMAIDAELNARIITPEEAKLKRSELEQESNFFGSMDGAMKFVKGDAMAGMIILVVDILGGLVVGGLMNHMPFAVAGKTFTVLTVGDGLIAQIPALLVAIAAGMVVTRSASPRNMGTELASQLFNNPRVLGMSSGIILVLGTFIPGVHIPMYVLAAAVGATAYLKTRKANQVAAIDEEIGGAVDTPAEEINATMLRVDPISLEVGADLEALADPDGPAAGALLERLKHVRKRIAMEFGVIAPGVRVRPHPGIDPGAYQVRIKGDLVAEGDVMVSHVLGIGQNLDVPGLETEPTVDPIYNTPAVWIPASQQALAEQNGLQVFDAQDVVSTHVAEIIKQHLEELLTREEVAELLNMARQEAPTVVQELVPNLLTLGQIRLVLQNLVREQVPIKDLGTILNALADNSYNTKDPFQLTEFVRQALGRKICQRYQTPDGTLRAFVLSPDVERTIQNSIQLNESGQFLALDPDSSNRLHANLAQALQEHRGTVLDPVIVCPPRIRRFVKKLFERSFTKLVVLSYAEIVAGVQVENIDTIQM